MFDEELSATQIAQKTEISLQLVKYHLTKLQDLGVVNTSKIEKNSKSQDMKIYTATKFSIVIVPPTLSKKTKESKSLVRSFKYIYKVAGLGIATGVSGLFSLSLSSEQLPVDNTRMELSYDPSQKMMGSTPKDTSTAMSAPMMESESSDLTQRGMDVAETITNSDTFGFELFLPFLILTIVLGGFTVYYFIKSKKSI